MEKILVNSRLISAVRYDSSLARLEIEFKSGRVVPYSDIPEQVYKNLINADSPGSYYRHHILERGPRPYTRSGG
ncbi:KTSC domain-containing protein [Rhizobium sp. BK376]|uniref:KTSC domain-containing protein n=1 Tax=Rhizobium sp. BK376 TaxID=2512149 RepID=UPI00104BC786|nr:KTSC domain-containing protein [Rhizobium sp. BK376]TCR81549.1 KTSC domain-containing protein [Rhizobium sp. BK376]